MRTLCLVWILSGCALASAGERSPIQIELFDEFASFTHRNHTGNRIGYRFFEHTPLTHGDPPPGPAEIKRSKRPRHVERNQARPGVKVFHRHITEEGWIPQDWTFYLAPVSDGIELALVVKTGDVGLPEFYGVQQCFRLTGASNATWRLKYACTPAFSEFDLWKASPEQSPSTSLTWVLRQGILQQLPAGTATVGCRTPYGETIDRWRSAGQLDALEYIGPYRARMLWTSDSGLILRTSKDRKWSTGLCWERTTHLSDHHPADCLHAVVNIGGVSPHAQRTVRGKIYWVAGPGETLVKRWRKDFPDAQ